MHALDRDLVGRETELIEALTDAVGTVYGDWARDIADVRLIGLPASRWGIGGKPVRAPAPSVTFGVRDGLFARPDAEQIVRRLIAEVTDAVVAVFGEAVRAGVGVELVGTPPGRTGLGGVLVSDGGD